MAQNFMGWLDQSLSQSLWCYVTRFARMSHQTQHSIDVPIIFIRIQQLKIMTIYAGYSGDA